MIGVPPKAFLDTQIISEVERGHIWADNWDRVSAYLRHATRYCISALTIGELLVALANANPQYFEKHKRRLRALLSPNPQAEVLDFIKYFVGQELGLTIQRPAHLEDDFLKKIDLILSAPSKDALLEGFSVPGTKSGQTVKIRIDRLVQESAASKDAYLEIMGYRKESSLPRVSPNKWASNVLKFYENSETPDLLAKIAERLSATYEFEMAVNKLAQNSNFTISKHVSDLLDGQQLCYLCDPNVVFITNDSDFRTRAAKSPQATRIKTFAEVLTCAESNSPLL